MTRVPTIMLVDDSLIVLEWVKIVLEQAGMRVITHPKPMGVGAIIVRERPDLVLIDLNMPTLDGDEVVRVARKSEAVAGTQLILHSSRPAKELESVTQRCGADGFIEKTLDEATLVRQIRAFLDRPRGAAKPAAPAPPPAAPAKPRLPVPKSTVPESSAAPPMPSRSSGPLRPLFVDDDVRILDGYRRTFGTEMNGKYASSVTEALAHLDSSDPPDIVVCDLVMPEMGGIELYEVAVRKNPQWRYRFVFVTGSTIAGPLLEGLEPNGAPVLKKPVDPATITGLLRVLRSA